jgi:hypothetical protein
MGTVPISFFFCSYEFCDIAQSDEHQQEDLAKNGNHPLEEEEEDV